MGFLAALFGVAVYFYGSAVLVLWFLSLAPPHFLPFRPPYSLYDKEAGRSVSAPAAALADVGLLLVFAVPHSFFARDAVKSHLALPAAFERPVYVLLASVTLHGCLVLWQPFGSDDGALWDTRGSGLLTALAMSGWALGFLWALTSTFALDHFSLFGLSQACGVDINRAVGLAPAQAFTTRWHYRLTAHPIMSGMLLALWSTPLMTAQRLLVAAVLSAYIAFAVYLLEEPQLVAQIGPEYAKYLSTVPRFCPFLPNARGAAPFVDPPSSSREVASSAASAKKE